MIVPGPFCFQNAAGRTIHSVPRRELEIRALDTEGETLKSTRPTIAVEPIVAGVGDDFFSPSWLQPSGNPPH